MDGSDTEQHGEVARRWPRLVAAGTALVVVVAAVGVAIVRSGDDGPQVIEIAGGGGAGDALATSEADGDTARGVLDGMSAARFEFELGDGARIDADEASAWRLDPPDDLQAAATELAERFGLGSPEAPEYDPASLIAGPGDGSGPTLWVGPTGEWSYSDPAGRVVWDCAEPGLIDPPEAADAPADGEATAEGETTTEGAGDAGPPPDDPGAECDPPEAPTGVPSVDEARTLAQELFDDLDLPGTVTVHEAFADEWSARVQGLVELDGVPTDLRVSAGWGGDAALMSVGGTLAEPIQVDGYPTIDAEQAVERLQDPATLGWGGGHLPNVPMDTPVTDSGAAGAAPAEQGPAEPSTDDEGSPEGSGEEPPPTGSEPLPTEPEPLPTEPEDQPLPTEPKPLPGDGEAEPVTVTLTGVEQVLLTHMDTDRVAWLLPGYRFTDDAGGIWQVLAVDDDYLEVAEPTEPGATPDPAGDPAGGEGSGSVEPDPGGEDVAEPSGPAEPDDDGGSGDGGAADGDAGDDPEDRDARMQEMQEMAQRLADEVVGLSEHEAIEVIEAEGLVARVVARDDEQLEVTTDLSYQRINLEVDDGVVTAASVG